MNPKITNAYMYAYSKTCIAVAYYDDDGDDCPDCLGGEQ